MNSKTEEIVKSLRGCSADVMDCKNCVAEWGRKYGYCFNSLRLYAADRLEELETELSKLKEQQRWIPVTERLPEEGQRVVIVAENGFMGIADYRSDTTSLAIKFLGAIVSNATHWMPLPERPEEDE